jgi:hypothetical protein
MSEKPSGIEEPTWQRIFRFVLTAAISAVPCAILLWIFWTHDLHYNVYSDGEFWYREYFPTYFNVIVTWTLSILFGLIVAAIIQITHRR